MLHMSETMDEFRHRLKMEKVVHIADCSRYWEVELKNGDITADDFTRLKIYKVENCGSGSKCIYVPKL